MAFRLTLIGIGVSSILLLVLGIRGEVLVAYVGIYIVAVVGAIVLLISARSSAFVRQSSERGLLIQLALFSLIGLVGWILYIWGPMANTHLGNVAATFFPLLSVPVPILLLIYMRKLELKQQSREPTCERCGYSLTGLTRPRCPECGKAFDPSVLKDVGSAGSSGTGDSHSSETSQ
jgi:hypothetical protein